MSVTDPAVELTICASVRPTESYVTSSLREAARCGVAGGSYLFPATRTGDAAPAWQLSTGTSDDSQMCMHCQPAVTRRLAQLDTIRPAAAASACIDWLCWPIVFNMGFSGMFESRLYQYRPANAKTTNVIFTLGVQTIRLYSCDVYVGGKVRVGPLSEFMIFLDLQHCGSK